jgi:hypothetical protein
MELHIVTGSIVLGSDATPMVLIGDFKRADGTVEISDVSMRCRYDGSKLTQLLYSRGRSAICTKRRSIFTLKSPSYLCGPTSITLGPSWLMGGRCTSS